MAMCVQEANDCCCPEMPGALDTCPPIPPPPPSKYFHEVGAEMVGNQLIIRMEKTKDKKPKKKGTWLPPCDCDVIEIKRPTSTKGPRITNGGDNNQILFRIHSKQHLNKKSDPNYMPQAVAYKINRAGTDDPSHCRKITVYPQLGGPVQQQVFTDHTTDGDCDVYLLRVKKKNESPEEAHKRNLEIELRTPKKPDKLVCPKPPVIVPPDPTPEPSMVLPTLCKLKTEEELQCPDEQPKPKPVKKKKKKKKSGPKLPSNCVW